MKDRPPPNASEYTKWLKEKANLELTIADARMRIPAYERHSIISQIPTSLSLTRVGLTLFKNSISVPPFNPLVLGGLALWLDAADATALFSNTLGTTPATNGGAVRHWKDKSGLGRNATTAGSDMTYVSGGFNGLNTIRGNQSTTAYSVGFTIPSVTISTTNSTSIFVVYNQLVAPTIVGTMDSRFVFMPTPNNLHLFNRSPGSGGTTTNFVTSLNGSTSGGSSYAPTIPYASIFEAVYTPNTGTLYGNGTPYNTLTTTGGGSGALNSPFTLGLFSESMQGNICELLIFGTALSTTQRQQVEGYLAWKWGLQASLPSNHPYFNVKP